MQESPRVPSRIFSFPRLSERYARDVRCVRRLFVKSCVVLRGVMFWCFLVPPEYHNFLYRGCVFRVFVVAESYESRETERVVCGVQRRTRDFIGKYFCDEFRFYPDVGRDFFIRHVLFWGCLCTEFLDAEFGFAELSIGESGAEARDRVVAAVVSPNPKKQSPDAKLRAFPPSFI